MTNELNMFEDSPKEYISYIMSKDSEKYGKTVHIQ